MCRSSNPFTLQPIPRVPINRRLLPHVFTLAALAGAPTSDAQYAPAEPGAATAEVATANYEWADADRDRTVPVKIYYPNRGAGPFPVILFSHGLGGSRETYAYLGRHWAGHGYVSAHLQHPGSDNAVWEGEQQPIDALRAAALDPRNAIDRLGDVSFVLDQLEDLNRAETPLHGRLDLKHVGIAGHSFGAHTTLAAVGQVAVGPRGWELSWADPRISAAIPMSAPVPKQRDRLDRVYRNIRVPCLHMTGTLDASLIGETAVADRRIPFDHITGAEQYLITFEGGDHMIFSGRPRSTAASSKDAVFQSLICAGSTAFWDAYLKENEEARTWLTDGAFATTLGENGTLEVKRPGLNENAQ